MSTLVPSLYLRGGSLHWKGPRESESPPQVAEIVPGGAPGSSGRFLIVSGTLGAVASVCFAGAELLFLQHSSEITSNSKPCRPYRPTVCTFGKQLPQ